MRIIWSRLAVERVSEIAQYIARDDTSAASRWVDALFKRVDRVKEFPQSGRQVPEANRQDLREILFGNYRVIYRIEIKRISILTVRHGKQLLPPEDLRE